MGLCYGKFFWYIPWCLNRDHAIVIAKWDHAMVNCCGAIVNTMAAEMGTGISSGNLYILYFTVIDLEVQRLIKVNKNG